jgi:hypothetical protein
MRLAAISCDPHLQASSCGFGTLRDMDNAVLSKERFADDRQETLQDDCYGILPLESFVTLQPAFISLLILWQI